jgi:uncharacterized protein YneF (UPF0154 family)
MNEIMIVAIITHALVCGIVIGYIMGRKYMSEAMELLKHNNRYLHGENIHLREYTKHVE